MIHPVPKPAPKERSPRPLKRRAWINQRRIKPRRGPWRSKEYRADVRTLPCCAPGAPLGCSGPVDASHTGGIAEGKGAGLKTSDANCVPHCRKHHREYEQRRGVFAMTEETRRFYEDEAVHETQVHLGHRKAA